MRVLVLFFIAALVSSQNLAYSYDQPANSLSPTEIRKFLNVLNSVNSSQNTSPCSTATGDSPCQTWRDYLRKNAQTTTDPEGKLMQSIPPGTQVLLLGEDHQDPARAHLSELLERLEKSSWAPDCLFLEESSDFQSAYDSFVKGDIDRAGLSQEMQKVSVQMDPSHDPSAPNPADYDQPWINAAQMAGHYKISVIAMDEPLTPKIERFMSGVDSAGMQVRNNLMSERIANAFKSGQCHRAVTFNGYAHLIEQTSAYDTLPNLLKAQALAPYSVYYRESSSTWSNDLVSGCDVSDIIQSMSSPVSGIVFPGVSSSLQIFPIEKDCDGQPCHPIHPDSVNFWMSFSN